MTTTYRTVVLHLPATPLGLLPEGWTIEHRCALCHQRVTSDQLVAHAQDHEVEGHGAGDGSFQSRETSGRLAPEHPRPGEDALRTPRSP